MHNFLRTRKEDQGSGRRNTNHGLPTLHREMRHHNHQLQFSTMRRPQCTRTQRKRSSREQPLRNSNLQAIRTTQRRDLPHTVLWTKKYNKGDDRADQGKTASKFHILQPTKRSRRSRRYGGRHNSKLRFLPSYHQPHHRNRFRTIHCNRRQARNRRKRSRCRETMCTLRRNKQAQGSKSLFHLQGGLYKTNAPSARGLPTKRRTFPRKNYGKARNNVPFSTLPYKRATHTKRRPQYTNQ